MTYNSNVERLYVLVLNSVDFHHCSLWYVLFLDFHRQIMTNVIESIYTKLTEAKDIMDTMLDLGVEAAAESVEVTLCSARSAVNTVMEINIAQMMASSVDKMIFKSDDLLEHFLPITDEEFCKTMQFPLLIIPILISLTSKFICLFYFYSHLSLPSYSGWPIILKL